MISFEEFEELITAEALRLDIYPEEINIGYNFEKGWTVESSFFDSEEINKLKQFVKENEIEFNKRQNTERDIEESYKSQRMGNLSVSYRSWQE